MPVPSSESARLKVIRCKLLLVIGWVEARKLNGSGNFARREYIGADGLAKIVDITIEYICAGRVGSGFKPSAAVVGIVPSARMFMRVSRTIVPGMQAVPAHPAG